MLLPTCPGQTKPFRLFELSREGVRMSLEQATREALEGCAGLRVTVANHDDICGCHVVWVMQHVKLPDPEKWRFFSKGFLVDEREHFESAADFDYVIRSWAKRAWQEREEVGLYQIQDAYTFERPEAE